MEYNENFVYSSLKDTFALIKEILFTSDFITSYKPYNVINGNNDEDAIIDWVINGENSTTKVTSRSVATENSSQHFKSKVIGNAKCFGHVECDAIIMENGKVLPGYDWYGFFMFGIKSVVIVLPIVYIITYIISLVELASFHYLLHLCIIVQ